MPDRAWLQLVCALLWVLACLSGSVGQAAEPVALDGDARLEASAAAIRRGEALRAAGRVSEALAALEAAVATARATGEPALELAAEAALASAWIDSGRAAEALESLAGLQLRARSAKLPALEAAIAHEIARALEQLGDLDGASARYAEAAELAREADDSGLAFRARVGRAAAAVARAADPVAARACAEAAAAGEGVVLQPEFALSWLRLARAEAVLARGEPAGSQSARESLARAEAAAPGNELIASHVAGLRAVERAEAGALERAEYLGRTALGHALRAGRSDLELRWRALLARVARARGAQDAAVRELERAVDVLEPLAPALRSRGSESRLISSWERTDSGLYRELVDLLLQRARARKDDEAARRDRLAAQATLERFRAAELRDYFQDDCVDAYRERVADPASVSASAAIVYPVALPDRLELLVFHGHSLEQVTVAVGADELEARTRELRRGLVNRTRRRYRAPARALYGWLIAPIDSHLRALKVDTLVFVPGGALRTVPMAALMEGDTFLIERYAIGTIPGLELTDPSPVDREDLEAFLGGVSEARQGFPALASVPEELGHLQARVGGTLLLDEAFATRAITRTLEERAFNVVHFATHAQFGSEAEDSFLLTWDGRLSMDDLAEAVGAFRYRETPLELLLLSACQTAEGDERAALGLAGLAVKAGARSALASLWSVSDRATQQLVARFYDGLLEPGVTRAQALQRAQLGLLEDPALRHPAYWAPFLILNSWL